MLFYILINYYISVFFNKNTLFYKLNSLFFKYKLFATSKYQILY